MHNKLQSIYTIPVSPFKMVIAFLFLCLQVNPILAQSAESNKSKNLQTIEGVKYYIHVVTKGETLYAISKTYNCLVADILMDNPGAIDGIQSGIILKIPAEKKTKNTEIATSTNSSTDKTIVYKVEKGETLYSIAKKNNTTVDKLIALNPDLKNGLKADQIINISEKGITTNITTPKTTPVVSSLNTPPPAPHYQH